MAVERWHHVDFSQQKNVVKKQLFRTLETEEFLTMARKPWFFQGLQVSNGFLSRFWHVPCNCRQASDGTLRIRRMSK
jgi:hypothetical protein